MNVNSMGALFDWYCCIIGLLPLLSGCYWVGTSVAWSECYWAGTAVPWSGCYWASSVELLATTRNAHSEHRQNDRTTSSPKDQGVYMTVWGYDYALQVS